MKIAIRFDMRLCGLGVVLLIFFFVGDGLRAEKSCEQVLKWLSLNLFQEPLKLEKLDIEKTILETNLEGGFELHEWRLKGLKNPDDSSGFILFLIETDGSKRIEIESLFGSKSIPGIGRALKRELRQTYPDHLIVSSLSMKNAQRLLEALKENPLEPDFSNVPAISALEDDFELDFNFQRNVAGQIHLMEVQLLMKKGLGSKSRWLNKSEILNDENYREWISSNFLATAFFQEKNEQQDPSENQNPQDIQLADVFEAFSRGLNPDLSNREQRLAFEAYLKMQFGSSQVNISQPQREDPVDLVRDFQQKYPQIKKPNFLSLILDSRPGVASQTESESLSFLREHLSKLKQLQAKFLNPEANLGFWKSLFDAKNLSNQEFLLELENILHPISVAHLTNVDRFDSALVTHLFRALERRVETLAKTNDRSKKVERALVDLVHFSSLLNPDLISALDEKNESLVLRNIERALRDRDELAKSLGFKAGFEEILSTYQVKQPSGLESKESLESFVRNLKSESEKESAQLNLSSRRLRQLSLIESPFRSCVGSDCSSRESFSEAFDPNYVYFTVTDEKNRSSGLFTIVLGEALFQGKTIRVAFLDKIQNLSLSDLEIALDALRETLAADGIRLIAATDLGDHNGLSNDESIKNFLRSNDWLSDESLQAFQPYHHSYSFKHVHTRARKTFDWRFVEPMRSGKKFLVDEGTADKGIFSNDFEFDRTLKPFFDLKSSSDLDNQMRYIPMMQILAHAKVSVDPQFHETLEAWIKSSETSFKLKKQAMIYWLQEDKNEFFEKLKFLNENEQLDFVQNLLETPRYRAFLFQNQNEWASLLYQFKANKAVAEQLLKGVDVEDSKEYLAWLQNEEIRESDFLSLLRFRTLGSSFLTREELDVAKKHLGLSAIFADLTNRDKEGSAPIHKAADFANSELFEFVTLEFSDEDLLSLLRLSQKDGKKTIHLLAGSIRTESFEALILKKPPEFWRDLLLEPESNELGRRTIHFLSEKNQISLLELIASKLSENDFLTVLQAKDLGSNQSLHFAARMGNTDFFEWVKAQVGVEQMMALLAAKNFENKNVAETAARYMRSSLIHWIHDSL